MAPTGSGSWGFLFLGAPVEVERVVCFIDGFNLYHAIVRLGEPHLKWLDLRRLMQRYTYNSAPMPAPGREEALPPVLREFVAACR